MAQTDDWLDELVRQHENREEAAWCCLRDISVREAIRKHMAENELEKLRILSSLADMYGQYCDGPFGHHFMGAGEGAIEILERYNLAVEHKGVNYAAVDKLEEKIAALQQRQPEGE